MLLCTHILVCVASVQTKFLTFFIGGNVLGEMVDCSPSFGLPLRHLEDYTFFMLFLNFLTKFYIFLKTKNKN